MKAVIFCSACKDIDPKYNEAAREIVRGLSSLGIEIVSGGTVKGTMGVIADECRRLGVPHTGIIPRFMAPVSYPDLDSVIWTDTMSERKGLMREGADVAIALPGGIGTLDELIETLVLAKLDLFHGRVMALDIDGFYSPLIALLDHYVATGMLEEASRSLITFPPTVSDLIKSLR
ncbi:MAG: TIGR00730 family Rossman fold protein [Bacteroidales bacterium]|jgi:hypothetical protein|nr:TIGR00730 family Rossman fold protein [Bacteroidales bacterium]